jgi:hypothetical protein
MGRNQIGPGSGLTVALFFKLWELCIIPKF